VITKFHFITGSRETVPWNLKYGTLTLHNDLALVHLPTKMVRKNFSFQNFISSS
jgi:hypothetical protein